MPFDDDKLQASGLLVNGLTQAVETPIIRLDGHALSRTNSVPGDAPRIYNEDDLLRLETGTKIHDSLAFGGGMSWLGVLSWQCMEYLPFRRMDMQPDGSWKPINWPLPRGETRDMPNNALVHRSVIRRMEADRTYRPGNLILGGGGRGVRRAPEKAGIGEWQTAIEVDRVNQAMIRKRPGDIGLASKHK